MYNGADDATVGDAPRNYMYSFKVGECHLSVLFEMSNSEPGNCVISEVMLVNPAHEGTMEELYYISE